MTVYSEIDTTTSDWESIPFEVNGVQFISKVNKFSDMGKQLLQIPVKIVQDMNIGAITSILGNPSLMTRDELVAELYRVNIGGSQAILELA